RKTLEKFRLIAPFFTGSQPSVLRTLREWAESDEYYKKAKFEVISGAAGALAPFKVASNERQDTWERQAVTLHATTIPSRILQNAAIGFLKRTGNGFGQVNEPS